MGVYTKSKPSVMNPIPHLGIELEFDINTDRSVFKSWCKNQILREGMSSCARIDYELIASQEMNKAKFGWELSLLSTEWLYKSEIEKLLAILKKTEAYIDDRCGLHFHVDCRYRNRIDVYHTLVKHQDYLFACAEEARRESPYCIPNNPYAEPTRNNAIYPHDKYDTVEVRVFESTFDLEKIDFFAKTILGLVNFNNGLDLPAAFQKGE